MQPSNWPTQPDVSLEGPVHFTRLRHMARSAAHYRSAILEPKEPTAAMRFGSIVHAMLFRQELLVWKGRRAGKDWDAFESEHPGALIATADDYDRARRCCDAIGANRDATRVLVGQHEVSRSWSVLGRACEGRLDVLGDGYVTELKTTTNAEPVTFLRGAQRMAYHGQVPWYIDGVGAAGWDGFMVAVETTAPFAVTVIQLTAAKMEEGRKLNRLLFERLLVCEAANEWPAYSQCVVPWDVHDVEGVPLLIDGEEVEAA